MFYIPGDWSSKLKDGFNLWALCRVLKEHKDKWLKLLWVLIGLTFLDVLVAQVLLEAGLWAKIAHWFNTTIVASPKSTQYMTTPIQIQFGFYRLMEAALAMIASLVLTRRFLDDTASTPTSLWRYAARSIIAALMFFFYVLVALPGVGVVWYVGRTVLWPAHRYNFLTCLGYPVVAILAAFYVLYFLGQALVFWSFGGWAVLDGYSVDQAYARGRALLSAHWFYLVGPCFYALFARTILTKALAVGTTDALGLMIVGASVNYFLPLASVTIFLVYYKKVSLSLEQQSEE